MQATGQNTQLIDQSPLILMKVKAGPTETPMKRRLWVGSLDPRVSVTDLRNVFQTYGEIEKVTRYEKYAFVQFGSASDMEQALVSEQGILGFYGRPALVDYARPMRKMAEYDSTTQPTDVEDGESDHPAQVNPVNACSTLSKWNSVQPRPGTNGWPKKQRDVDPGLKMIDARSDGSRSIVDVVLTPPENMCVNQETRPEMGTTLKFEVDANEVVRHPAAFKKLIEALQELGGM